MALAPLRSGAELLQEEFQKNPELNEEDIDHIRKWLETEDGLEIMDELGIAAFLQACYFDVELAKKTLKNYFYSLVAYPEFTRNLNVENEAVKLAMETNVFWVMPKPLPNGNRVIYSKMMNPDWKVFNPDEQFKISFMVLLLFTRAFGTANGFEIIADMEYLSFGHMTRFSLFQSKKLMFYVQDASAIRTKVIHFIRTPSWIEKFLMLLRPFLKKELAHLLQIYPNMDSLEEVIPKECLPSDFGGSQPSINELHDEMKQFLVKNKDFLYEMDEKYTKYREHMEEVAKERNKGSWKSWFGAK